MGEDDGDGSVRLHARAFSSLAREVLCLSVLLHARSGVHTASTLPRNRGWARGPSSRSLLKHQPRNRERARGRPAIAGDGPTLLSLKIQEAGTHDIVCELLPIFVAQGLQCRHVYTQRGSLFTRNVFGF